MDNNIEHKNLRTVLDDFGRMVIEELKNNLISLGKNNTGNLINSLTYEIIDTDNKLTVNILGADYLKVVDKGRAPGKQPPVSKLLPWVRSKNIKIGKTPESSAFAIAKSIADKGIKPTNVIDKTIENVKNNKMYMIENAIQKDLYDHVINEIKNELKNI